MSSDNLLIRGGLISINGEELHLFNESDSKPLYRRALSNVRLRRLRKNNSHNDENLSKMRKLEHLNYQAWSFPIKQYLIACNYADKIANSFYFNNYILLCILLAVLIVGVETYPAYAENVIISNIDDVILYSFTAEVLFKIMSEGTAPLLYFIGKKWRWNWFDFLIVLLSLPFIPFQAGQLKMLRLVRLMRLAKVFRRISSLQVIIMGVYGGLRSIIYIVLLMMMTFYLYSIAGVIFFSANDPWHFKNIEVSMLTLLSVATMDSWGDVFYINYFGCDTYDGGIYSSIVTCGSPTANPVFTAFYFISFVIFTSFCILSLFIGAVSMSMADSMMTREKEKAKVRNEKRRNQMDKIAVQYSNKSKMSRKMLRHASLIEMVFAGEDLYAWEMEYDNPHSFKELYQRYFSFYCQDLLANTFFQQFVTAVIFLAAISAGIETDKEFSSSISNLLFVIGWIVQCIFLFEVLLKIVAEEAKPWKYFYDGWNVFDILIVCASFFPSSGGSSTVTVFRLLRLLRVLKLMRAVPELQVLVTSVLRCSTSIAYILFILAIFYYFFAIIGLTFFAENDPWHFGTLHFAMLILFDASTQDNWSQIMYISLYGCDKYPGNQPGDCSNPLVQFELTAMYWTVFILVGSLVLLALFIGVVSKSMEESKNDQQTQLKVESRAKEIATTANVDTNTLALYKEVFDEVDFTHCNRIGKIEMRFGLLVSGTALEDKDFDEFWAKVDQDDSGSIDFSEFLEFILEMKGKLLDYKLFHSAAAVAEDVCEIYNDDEYVYNESDGFEVEAGESPGAKHSKPFKTSKSSISVEKKFHDGKRLTKEQKFAVFKSFGQGSKYIAKDISDDDSSLVGDDKLNESPAPTLNKIDNDCKRSYSQEVGLFASIENDGNFSKVRFTTESDDFIESEQFSMRQGGIEDNVFNNIEGSERSLPQVVDATPSTDNSARGSVLDNEKFQVQDAKDGEPKDFNSPLSNSNSNSKQSQNIDFQGFPVLPFGYHPYFPSNFPSKTSFDTSEKHAINFRDSIDSNQSEAAHYFMSMNQYYAQQFFFGQQLNSNTNTNTSPFIDQVQDSPADSESQIGSTETPQFGWRVMPISFGYNSSEFNFDYKNYNSWNWEDKVDSEIKIKRKRTSLRKIKKSKIMSI